jgi:hypothetical protein
MALESDWRCPGKPTNEQALFSEAQTEWSLTNCNISLTNCIQQIIFSINIV